LQVPALLPDPSDRELQAWEPIVFGKPGMFAVSALTDGEKIVTLLHEKIFVVSVAILSPAELVKNEDDNLAPKVGDATMVARATTVNNAVILAVI
jgi:hypothetical protein